MNERIQELVKEAGGHFSTRNLASNPVQFVERVELWDDRIEKFAELIVKECANIAFAQANHYAETQNKGSASSAADCVGRLIKIEFGVE
jgi:hypothetical protein